MTIILGRSLGAKGSYGIVYANPNGLFHGRVLVGTQADRHDRPPSPYSGTEPDVIVSRLAFYSGRKKDSPCRGIYSTYHYRCANHTGTLWHYATGRINVGTDPTRQYI